ncbi:MAG: XRE family transcriptional regulator [Flavobacterium sp.]|nr:MAG: XRE family transcriptional regulator [Flavobacterium sp.]
MESNNSSSDREKIAARLKDARIQSGLSQAQAADKLNLQRPAISEIEAGKRKVSAEEIIQFAELYKVDRKWLLLEENVSNDLATEQFNVAARELSKMKQEDRLKLYEILKILPK